MKKMIFILVLSLIAVSKSNDYLREMARGIYKGYYHIKDKWIAKIKQNGKQIHLGSFDYEEEAQYARWCAEKILFKEFMFPKEEPVLPVKRKQEIFELVSKKVQRL